MSRWDNEFKEHTIHDTLQEIKSCLDVEIQDTNDEHHSEKRRINKIVLLIEEILNRSGTQNSDNLLSSNFSI